MRKRGFAIQALVVLSLLFAPAAGARERLAMVTFRVQVPQYTPPDAGIYITGDISALGPWDPGKIELGKIGDGLYAVTLVLPVASTLTYRITRGDWETAEKGEDFEEMPDRELLVSGDEVVRFSVANWRDFASGRGNRTLTGNFKYHEHFSATQLGNERTILVYLPPGYGDDGGRRYPVLYMQDGQNVFDAASSFTGVEWGADEAVERLVAAGQMEPAIVVGIYNTDGRIFEYTPYPDAEHGGGGGDLYADFVLNDLKPFIDSTYMTLPQREHTAILGSSMGGLISLYVGWRFSDTFSIVGAMSPSYYWADGELIKMIESYRGPPKDLRIWLDVGRAEGWTQGEDPRNALLLHRRLRDALVQHGLELGRTLTCVEEEGAIHNERAWAARLPRALRFLFPPEGTKRR